jgi:hypothetical protein
VEPVIGNSSVTKRQVKRKWVWFTLVGIVLLPIACFGELLFTDCWLLECPPKRSFNVLDLELPAYLFPVGSYVNPYSPSRDATGTIEDASMTIFFPDSSTSAIFYVDRFRNSGGAQERMGNAKGDFYSHYRNVYEQNFESQIAKQVFYGCGVFVDDRLVCRYEAVYEEFHVFFGSDMNDSMTAARFENIVKFIDANMMSKLGAAE